MLQNMRKFSKSWISNILLGVLSLCFVSWGVGDIISARVETAVAKVDGKPIDQQEFRREYTNILRSQNITGEEAKKLGVGNQIMEQMISRKALDNVVDKLGLTASDAMITASIQRIPVFSGLTGQFDRRVFEQTIERIGYSEQGFIELMRADTARTQLVRAVEGGFALPPGYAKAMFAYFTELRAAEYFVVDAKALGTIRTPSDAELTAFVKAHAASFSTPEYRDLSYAWLSPKDVASTIKVSDDQVKKAYDEHIGDYVIPEKRDIEQLLFTSEAAAKAAKDKTAKGTAFPQLTNEKGEKATALPGMSADSLVDTAVAKAVFALPKDGISAPVKTVAGGWAIYHVTAITPGSTRSLDQVKDEIRDKIVQELAQGKLADISNVYTDASSAGATISDAAKKAGMHVARVQAVDAAGLSPAGAKVDIPDDPEFRSAVFSAEVGEEGDPQTTKAGLLFVLSVNGTTPPKVKPLDQVRTAALAAWTSQERANLLKKKATELAAEANRENSLAGAAKSIGASIQNSEAINHRTANDTFSQQLVGALYSAKPGQTVSGIKAGGDYVVARLTGIMHPPLPEKSPDYIAAVHEMNQSFAGGITESYISQLRADQGVTTNPKLINSIIGGEGS